MSNKLVTSTQIKDGLLLDASKRSIQRYLRNGAELKFGKFSSKPPLQIGHKEKRLEWAKKYVAFGANWDKVIFSDEKKFNMDGPDGIRRFWYKPGLPKKPSQNIIALWVA